MKFWLNNVVVWNGIITEYHVIYSLVDDSSIRLAEYNEWLEYISINKG